MRQSEWPRVAKAGKRTGAGSGGLVLLLLLAVPLLLW